MDGPGPTLLHWTPRPLLAGYRHLSTSSLFLLLHPTHTPLYSPDPPQPSSLTYTFTFIFALFLLKGPGFALPPWYPLQLTLLPLSELVTTLSYDHQPNRVLHSKPVRSRGLGDPPHPDSDMNSTGSLQSNTKKRTTFSRRRVLEFSVRLRSY